MDLGYLGEVQLTGSWTPIRMSFSSKEGETCSGFRCSSQMDVIGRGGEGGEDEEVGPLHQRSIIGWASCECRIVTYVVSVGRWRSLCRV